MEHVGIDLGGRQSQICVRGDDGTVVEERRWPTAELPAYLARRGPSRVILETCAEAFRIADAAKECGHEVRVVSATLVRSLGVGAHGIKTDRRDAQVLSQVSCRIDLPSVHVPSSRSRELRSLCNSRDALVKTRTLLVNSVRGWLRKRVLRPKSGGTVTFVQRVRELLLASELGLPQHIEAELVVIATISTQITALAKELAVLAKADPICRRLMTVPGVGPLTAIRYLTTLDEVGRFPSAHRVASYLGLAPGEHSSSARVQRTGITKAGSTALRWLLIEAAWRIRRLQPGSSIARWAAQIEARRGRAVSIVALARKLALILFALWRDQANYDPARAARAQEVPEL